MPLSLFFNLCCIGCFGRSDFVCMNEQCEKLGLDPYAIRCYRGSLIIESIPSKLPSYSFISCLSKLALHIVSLTFLQYNVSQPSPNTSTQRSQDKQYSQYDMWEQPGRCTKCNYQNMKRVVFCDGGIGYNDETDEPIKCAQRLSGHQVSPQNSQV